MFTIRDCLNFDFIPWKKNLLSFEGNIDREIDYVSVNDLPLDDFIRKNEAVIAIATPYIEQPNLMLEFVKGLVEAEASVFLLSLPSDEMELDEKSRIYAEEHGLCVYLIPWDVRFADIIEEILDNIHYIYEKDLELFRDLQEKLLEAFLGNEDIVRAVDLIGEMLSCNVSLSYPNGDIIGMSRITEGMKRMELVAENSTFAILYHDREMSDKSASMLKQSLSPLFSLWFYRDELIETTNRIARDDFVWNLANGADIDNADIARTAELMNFKLKRFYSCIVGRVGLTDNHSEESELLWIESNIMTIQTEIASIAAEMHFEVMITHHENQLIIYFENQAEYTRQNINQFLTAIESRLEGKSGSIKFSWGVSEIKDERTAFKDYYIHANLASELCSNDVQRTNRYFYESSLVYTIMSDLFDDDEFFDDTLDILNPIIEYGKQKNNGIIDTLKVYLSTRSIAETSRILGRHRQTVIYQLNRLEELTGMSLKSYDDLYLLETCVRLHFGLNIEK